MESGSRQLSRVGVIGVNWSLITGWTKNDPTCFCQNFVKYLPNLLIFGTRIAKAIEICEVCSLSTSPNLC